jgi:hypothetical protein
MLASTASTDVTSTLTDEGLLGDTAVPVIAKQQTWRLFSAERIRLVFESGEN